MLYKRILWRSGGDLEGSKMKNLNKPYKQIVKRFVCPFFSRYPYSDILPYVSVTVHVG